MITFRSPLEARLDEIDAAHTRALRCGGLTLARQIRTGRQLYQDARDAVGAAIDQHGDAERAPTTADVATLVLRWLSESHRTLPEGMAALLLDEARFVLGEDLAGERAA